MYLYPRDLKSKPNLWFWKMRDVVILAFLSILGIFALINMGWILPVTGAVTYGIATLRVEDTSILDYILHACVFFFSQQEYLWERKD
ncbi:MAG: hypothetical protein RR945_01755 [Erysipelotrichaceae bacterium]